MRRDEKAAIGRAMLDKGAAHVAETLCEDPSTIEYLRAAVTDPEAAPGEAAPLPCPFCRSTKVGDASGGLVRGHRVTCYGCGAHGPVKHTEADSTAAWNSRPASPGAKGGGRRG